MSVVTTRGGVPRVFLEGVPTGGREHQFKFATEYLIIRATANPCKVYFTKDDYDNDVNYVTVPVPAADTPHGEWQGPVEATKIWLKGDGGTSTVEMVSFQRRG